MLSRAHGCVAWCCDWVVLRLGGALRDLPYIRTSLRLALEPLPFLVLILDALSSSKAMYNVTNWSFHITLLTSANAGKEDKASRLKRAQDLYRQAQFIVEQHGDVQQSGVLILKALAEERKAENTGLQLINVIKYRPKTKLDFSFRS